MVKYSYKVVDAEGNMHSGTMEARSEGDVISALNARNQYIIEVTGGAKQSFLNKDIQIGGSVKLDDIVIFCRQLSALLKAGVPLDRALTTLQAQTEKPKMKEEILKLSAQIKQGSVTSAAMAEQSNIFPEILVRAIEAGEKTGNLDDAFLKMADYFHKSLNLQRRVKGAMAYPFVILFLTFGIAGGLLVFLIPEFAMFLEEAGGELPGLTQFYMNLSDFLVDYWYFVLAGFAGIAVVVRWWLRTPPGKMIFDTFKLSIPKVKVLLREIITARFSRSFSSMVSSGITIIEGLEIAAGAMGNKLAEQKVLEIIGEVKKGSPVSEQLRKTDMFPEMMLSMLSVGEETGTIDDMLIKVADYYEEVADNAIGKLLAMLPPVMIILVAALVGSIVLAMYLPVLDAITTAM